MSLLVSSIDVFAIAWVVGALLAVFVVSFAAMRVLRLRETRREIAHARRMHEAHVKAMKLVVDFEHTPVRGASRDRQLTGKARRRARRG